jgi:hypothetical protein
MKVLSKSGKFVRIISFVKEDACYRFSFNCLVVEIKEENVFHAV